MRLVCSSDWHGELPDLPDGDILVLAGDLLPVRDHTPEVQLAFMHQRLVPHLEKTSFRHVVMIAGNHDFAFAHYKPQELLPENMHYLQDSGVTCDGVKFWGSPWTRFLPGWVFMEQEDQLYGRWQQIPEDTDILVSHGPPHGCRDLTSPRFGSTNAGSVTLRERLTKDLSAKFVICGHIHEGYGTDMLGETNVVNVSLLNERYVAANKPVSIETEWAGMKEREADAV